MYDLIGRLKTRFTFGSAQEAVSPIWSADGTRVVFGARRQGALELHQKLASRAGSDELLLADPAADLQPVHWSPDGQFVVYVKAAIGTGNPSLNAGTIENGSADLWVLPINGDRKPFPFLQTQSAEVAGIESRFDVGAVRPLFDIRPGAAAGSLIYDVSSDGQRFLVASRPRDAALPPITLVTNWMGLLKQ